MKTGIDRALRLASGSSSEASDVSAPSLTITRPASGRPDSSSRARSSAGPSRVAVPAYFRFAVDGCLSTDDAKLKNRRTNLSDNALKRLPLGPVNCSCTNALRGWPLVSAMVMLRESSTSTATKFC